MARSVADAATVLSIIAGRDPLDNFTFAQPPVVPDYTKALDKNALKGARLGVARQFAGRNANVLAAFNASVELMAQMGATIVDPADFSDFAEISASGNETIVLLTDFKVRSLCASTGTLILSSPLMPGRRRELYFGAPGGPYRREEPGRSHSIQLCSC